MKTLNLICLLSTLPVYAYAGQVVIKPGNANVYIEQPELVVEQSASLPDESILWQLFHARKMTQLSLQIKQLKQRYPHWTVPEDLAAAISGGKNTVSNVADQPTKFPDERILWQLFHAKRYVQLNQQIKQFKRQYNGWRLPKDLVKGLQDLKHKGQPSVKKNNNSHKPGIISHAPCPNLPVQWEKAEAYLKSDHAAQAVTVYQDILIQCPTENRIQTLEKVRSQLEYTDFKSLIETGSRYLPSLYLDYLKYRTLKDRFFRDKSAHLKQHHYLVRELNELLSLFKDDDLAAAIGWRYFDLQQYQKAQPWFRKALDWNPANENAQYGELLSLQKAGNNNQALTTFAAIKKPSQSMQAIAIGILKVQAWEQFNHNQLDAAARNALRAEQIIGTTPEIDELKAWIATRGGQYDKASLLFDRLYQQSPSKPYAQGYIQNQAQVNRSVLSEKAMHFQGILLDEFKRFHSTELYDRKQFQSAYLLKPDAFQKLENIDSPYVEIGGLVRYKSGEEGLGRLDMFKAPIAAAGYTLNGDNTFKLTLSRVQLYSGRPEQCLASIGHLAPDVQAASACNANPSVSFSPTQQLNNALEIDFSYRKEGWFSPFVKIGSTPIGGMVDPSVTFDLGFVQQAEYGYWGLDVYSQPVRQSILSYTGIKDPYAQGLEWGGVLRTGIKPTFYYRFNDDWNAFGTFDLALLEGKSVEQNTAEAVSVAFSRNLHLAGFDYFNVGPTLNYEHFNQNLSHFTYGHGGYFSPDHYFNIGAGIDFLTEEGSPYILKGHLFGGYQDITEASAPWFPLENSNAGYYADTNRNGVSFNIELKGAWLMSPHIQLLAGAAVRKTNGFDDYTGGLFIRYFFDNRQGAFSTDLSDSMFSPMY